MNGGDPYNNLTTQHYFGTVLCLLLFFCQTNASAEADYHFYFNGKSIGNSTSGVFSVTVVADRMYNCAPVNTVGTGNNATVSISVVGILTSI